MSTHGRRRTPGRTPGSRRTPAAPPRPPGDRRPPGHSRAAPRHRNRGRHRRVRAAPTRAARQVRQGPRGPLRRRWGHRRRRRRRHTGRPPVARPRTRGARAYHLGFGCGGRAPGARGPSQPALGRGHPRRRAGREGVGRRPAGRGGGGRAARGRRRPGRAGPRVPARSGAAGSASCSITWSRAARRAASQPPSTTRTCSSPVTPSSTCGRR